MTYKVKATFDATVTMDDIGRAFQRMGIGPNNPAPGMLTHDNTVENGCIVFLEEWESKAVYESFVNKFAVPAFEAEGVPIAEVTEL